MVFFWILNFNISNGDSKVSSGASDSVSQAEAKEKDLKNNKPKIRKIILTPSKIKIKKNNNLYHGLWCNSPTF
jgi:hypothetical protein